MPSLDINIRKVEDKDIIRIMGFIYSLLNLRAFTGNHNHFETYYNMMKRNVKNGTAFVAGVTNSPLGYVSYEFRPGEVYIPELYVHEPFRKFGIGKILIKKISEIAAIRGDVISLKLPSVPGTERHESAKSFYKHLGFNCIFPNEYGSAEMFIPGRELYERLNSRN